MTELRTRAPHNIHNKPDVRTAFKTLLDEADEPKSVNACPFHCEPSDLDELGYCCHLVGFTNAKIPEGVVKNPSGVVEVLSAPDAVLRRRSILRGQNVPLEAGDVLVRITTSSRVYRMNWKAPEAPIHTAKTTPQMSAIIAAEVAKAVAQKALEEVTANKPSTAPQKPAVTPAPAG